MSLKTFLNLQSCQCLALALCLLLLNQQVVGKVEGRRRYESVFENLFEKGKDAANQLASFHFTVKDEKALRQNTDKVMAFVNANPDKVAIGIGLAASSWLLYQSIRLGMEIGRFFDEIEELKGQFNDVYRYKLPKLEEIYHRVREVTDCVELEKQRQYLKDVYDELMTYYKDLQKMIDMVGDIIEDVNEGKKDAGINAAISGIIAVLAGAAMVVGGPVAMPPLAWKSGVVATMGMSTISTTLSLKNAQDLAKASERLTILKHDLRGMREHVMEKSEKILQLIEEMLYKNRDDNSLVKGIFIGLVIACLFLFRLR